MNELIMQSKKTETEITQQNKNMKHTMEQVMDTVIRIEDKVVLPEQNPKVKELMVIMHSSEDPTLYIALRTQMKHKREAIKQCRKHNGNIWKKLSRSYPIRILAISFIVSKTSSKLTQL